MTDIHQHRILILDFGSQYAQLIARRVREIGVYCELFPADIEPQSIVNFKPNGIILSGGPETITVDKSLRAPDIIFQLGCPLLGICYGMQAMAQQLGGQVSSSQLPEFGYARVTVDKPQGILANVQDHVNANGAPELDVWMSHGDHVTQLPPDFEVICHTASAPIAGMANFAKQFYAFQFHPEVTHTRQGQRILQQFVLDVCGCEAQWTSRHIINETLTTLREQIGSDHVLVGLSGGVDSAVVAALLHQAIGKQLTCVLVDTGLLRLNEATEVERVFSQNLGVKLIVVDARHKFLKKLSGVSDPEKKRKIIGKLFIRIFEKEAKKIPNVKWLAQGTIYPDVIESAKTQSGKGHVIKSHHNVGGLPKRMHLKLVEPLRELFKDEVRKLGVELGLPYDLVYRHPFPGPGLAVRIIGSIFPAAVAILQRVDAIFMEALRAANLYHEISQAFAVFMPIKSVGVKGDARHYGYVVALRAVKTTDFMTAHWVDLPHELLSTVSHRIVNEVPEVSRVVYDVSGKPPATIEWE